jgi:hypothetical protein
MRAFAGAGAGEASGAAQSQPPAITAHTASRTTNCFLSVFICVYLWLTGFSSFKSS